MTRRDTLKGIAGILALGVAPSVFGGTAGLRKMLGARIGAWADGKPYEFVEAVHFDGTAACHIDTGFKANTTTTRFVGAFSFDNFATTRGLVGSRNIMTANSESCNLFAMATGTIRMDWAKGGNEYTQTLAANTKITVDVTRPTATIGGATHTFTNTGSVDQTYNFLIGNFSNGSASPYSAGLLGNCYECWLYSNGVIVRHYKPCKRKKDGAVGFLEELSKTFVTAAGMTIAA